MAQGLGHGTLCLHVMFWLLQEYPHGRGGAPGWSALGVLVAAILLAGLLGGAILVGADLATISSYLLIATAGSFLCIGVVLRPLPLLCVFAVVYAPFLFILRGQELGELAGVPITLSRALGGLLAVSLAFRVAIDLSRGADRRRIPEPLVLYLLFSAYLLFAFIRAPIPSLAVPLLVKYGAGLLTVLVVVINISTWRQVQMLYGGLVAGTLLASVVTVGTSLFGSTVIYQVSQGVERSVGALGGPNSSGNLAVFGMALLMPLLSGHSFTARWDRPLAVGGLSLHAFAIMLTLSRSAILGALLLILFWLTFVRRRDLGLAAKVVIVGVAIGAIVAAVVVVGPSQLQSRLSDVPGVGRAIDDPGAGSGRIGIWLGYWRIFRSGSITEMVAGRGLGSTDALAYQVEWNRLTRTYVGPHNEYLWLLVEVGVLGTALYLLFLWRLARWMLSRARRVPPGIARISLHTFLAYLATYQLTKEFFGWGITDMEIRWYFLLYMALMLAIGSMNIEAMEDHATDVGQEPGV